MILGSAVLTNKDYEDIRILRNKSYILCKIIIKDRYLLIGT